LKHENQGDDIVNLNFDVTLDKNKKIFNHTIFVSVKKEIKIAIIDGYVEYKGSLSQIKNKDQHNIKEINTKNDYVLKEADKDG